MDPGLSSSAPDYFDSRPGTDHGLRIGSLFSGIDGLGLGLERSALGQVLWQAEVDPDASSVLARHWPGVSNLGDVSQVHWELVEPVDVLCGGFPCQPASTAGKRKGRADDRWLWPEMHRAAAELRPGIVIIENVPGLLSVEDGHPFGGIVADLNSLGYEVAWGILGAAQVGCCHLRKRLFIVASHTPLPWRGRPCGRIVDQSITSLQQDLFGADVQMRCPVAGVARNGVIEMLSHSIWEEDLPSVAFASSSLLPTPSAINPNDGEDLDNWLCRREVLAAKGVNGNGMGTPLAVAVRLLPTPVASDGNGGRASKDPTATSRPSGAKVAISLFDALRLLPTPLARDGSHGGGQAKRYNDPARSNNLDDAVLTLLPTPRAADTTGACVHGKGGLDLCSTVALLPTPTVADSRGGRNMTAVRTRDPRDSGVSLSWTLTDIAYTERFAEYAPAISRWAAIFEEEPPPPTAIGSKGKPRLQADFVRWMMGFEAYWCKGLSRNSQLRCYGNAVVPQVAEHIGRVITSRLDIRVDLPVG